MTIVTKPLTENKNLKQKQPLFADGVPDGVPKSDVECGVEPKLVILGTRAQRVSTATTICLFLTALLVMSIGIIGGMYLYRQFARSQVRFHGWCSVPYNVHLKPIRPESLVSDTDFETLGYDKDNVETLDISNSFKQEFEIDLENENYEKIMVPDFGRGRKGKFVHDFRTNKTGIIDVNGHRCFVMPLNRERVLPPLTMHDLLKKLMGNYYRVDTEVVRETMRVVIPPITDFQSIGEYIERECRSLTTYLLERDDTNHVSKRSISENKEVIFSEFAGNKISELSINLNNIE